MCNPSETDAQQLSPNHFNIVLLYKTFERVCFPSVVSVRCGFVCISLIVMIASLFTVVLIVFVALLENSPYFQAATSIECLFESCNMLATM